MVELHLSADSAALGDLADERTCRARSRKVSGRLVERRGNGLPDVGSVPPPNFAELARIGYQWLVRAAAENETKADVGVPVHRRCCLGDGHEHRKFTGDRGEYGPNAELLLNLPPPSQHRMPPLFNNA